MCENHELRTRLAQVLSTGLGFTQIIEVSNLSEACQQVSTDLILVDLTVPDAGDELRWGNLRFCHPHAPLAVLFDILYDDKIRLAFIAGATGFLDRDTNEEALIARLNDVMQGVRVIPDVDFFERLQRIQAESQSKAHQPEPVDLLEQFTPRERDILKLLAQGLSNHEIADQLQLSEKP